MLLHEKQYVWAVSASGAGILSKDKQSLYVALKKPLKNRHRCKTRPPYGGGQLYSVTSNIIHTLSCIILNMKYDRLIPWDTVSGKLLYLFVLRLIPRVASKKNCCTRLKYISTNYVNADIRGLRIRPPIIDGNYAWGVNNKCRPRLQSADSANKLSTAGSNAVYILKYFHQSRCHYSAGFCERFNYDNLPWAAPTWIFS